MHLPCSFQFIKINHSQYEIYNCIILNNQKHK